MDLDITPFADHALRFLLIYMFLPTRSTLWRLRENIHSPLLKPAPPSKHRNVRQATEIRMSRLGSMGKLQRERECETEGGGEKREGRAMSFLWHWHSSLRWNWVLLGLFYYDVEYKRVITAKQLYVDWNYYSSHFKELLILSIPLSPTKHVLRFSTVSTQC